MSESAELRDLQDWLEHVMDGHYVALAIDRLIDAKIAEALGGHRNTNHPEEWE